jgi:hypothetical protein
MDPHGIPGDVAGHQVAVRRNGKVVKVVKLPKNLLPNRQEAKNATIYLIYNYL